MALTRKPTNLKIYEYGKIDIHHRQVKFEQSLNRLKKNKEINLTNKNIILSFIRDCGLGKTVIGKAKKKIGPARCSKYIRILLQLSEFFKKSFDEITQLDMENFVEKLENNKIRTIKGKPYSEETKADIKKTIKKFWKWKDGKNKVYPELVEWIDTYVTVKDVHALSRGEVEKMIESTSNPRDKALLMVFFDSGARAQELLNVRLMKEHLFWKESTGCYMIRLEYSKTKPRTISLLYAQII